MAKKKKKTKYRYVTRIKRRFRRIKDKRIPLAPTAGFALPAIFAKPFDNQWSSPMEASTWEGKIQSLIANIFGIGVGMPNTGFNQGFYAPLDKILNPFNFTAAGAIKGLFWGAIISKVMTKLGVNRTMKKIPFLGKYVKL